MQDQAGDDVNIIFGAMYDDSNTDSCDVTVIATGIGNKDSVPNNFSNFSNFNSSAGRKPAAPKPQQPYKGYQSPNARNNAAQNNRSNTTQNTRPVNNQLNPINVKSSVREEQIEIPSFLRQSPRR